MDTQPLFAGAAVVNATDVPDGAIHDAFASQQHGLLSALTTWVEDTRLKAYASGSYDGKPPRQGGLFGRDRYVTPHRPFDQMRTAYDAVCSDDIVSGVAEATESLAFSSMSFFCTDSDEQDACNQIAANIDLDSRMREIWRELFTVSQAYVACWWEKQEFKIRGTTKKGNQRRRTVTLVAPSELTLLDPLRVVPVGNTLFQRERLAYIATPTESDRFDNILSLQEPPDEIVSRLIVAKYEPDRLEQVELSELGINARHLWLLNERNVFRHTLTRPSYQRLAPVRLKAVFELLDMKNQLRQMERAHLIGGPLRVDQRIATPEGWKPIGAAQVGDRLFSVDGQLTEITEVHPQGFLPMHKVTFTDGAEVYCDESHLWTVHNRSGRERTIPLRQVMAEGIHDQNGAGTVYRHRIPVAQPLELPEAELPLDPYLVGYLIGNGSLSQSLPKITSAPGDEVEWQKVLPPGVTVRPYERREGFCPQYGLKGSRWHYNEVTEALRGLGLWGLTGADKYIPDCYLWASVAQRWALLQGLCDSDGYSHLAGGVEYSTVSSKLAEGVVHLVQSLGCVAKISIRDGRLGQHTLYRVWISVRQDGVPFRLARKVDAWRPRKHPIVRAIAKIGRSLDAEAVCIKTARSDGLFLTEGMVVTHNTNFIILITQGSDHLPARQEEIDNLTAMSKVVARVPIFVGDHRLNIQIITPKLDNTLRAERWNTIDSRITARLYQMFMLGNYSAGAGGDDSVKLVKVIARGMESRRHMIRRTLEKHIFRPMFDNNEELTSFPKLQFHPRAIALDFDAAYASFLFDLRQANEISRETILNQFDLDQDLEAEYRKREKDEFDDIFFTQVPFSTPNPANPANAPQPARPAQPQPGTGPRDNGGGNRNGGGAAPGTGQGQDPRRRAARPSASAWAGPEAMDCAREDGPAGASIPRSQDQGEGDADADAPT